MPHLSKFHCGIQLSAEVVMVSQNPTHSSEVKNALQYPYQMDVKTNSLHTMLTHSKR